jgi:S1-C subfamily serine protease
LADGDERVERSAAFYDDFEQPSRPSRLPALLAALLALLALAVGALALLAQREFVREAEVARLDREVAALEQRLEVLGALSDRVRSAEQSLARREAGIAPLAQRVLRSVFTVETYVGYGSGFVAWQEDGVSYLVTAYHVVEDAPMSSVTVTRKGGSWSGEIVAQDPKNDLALIRISARPAKTAPLWQQPRTKPPRAGDELLLVGSPFGLEGTVTTGVVSRVTKRWIQTDAAANPGNSGGPALDEQGRIVGVLVAGTRAGEGVNWIVPIALVCKRLRSC